MTFPNPLLGEAVQDLEEEMQWTPEQHQTGFKHHQQHHGSNNQLDFARFGAQFEFSPVYPRSFQVESGRGDLPIQFSSGRGDLSTQTAPPFRADQRQVDDFRAYHTDSFVNHEHQNQVAQYGFVERAEGDAGDTDALGKPDFIRTDGVLSAGSSHNFMIHDVNGFNGTSNGAFHDYLPLSVQTPGIFKVDQTKTVNPANLEQVPLLDPTWTLSTTDFGVPSKQDLAFRPKSKKRCRAQREEEFRSNPTRGQKHRGAMVNASGEALVSTEAVEFFELWLSKFKSIYPGEEHFQALTALTEVNIETVRLWFAQKWQRVMETSVNPSKTEVESPIGVAGLSISVHQQPETQASHPTLTGIRLEASSWVRNERGTKCSAVVNLAQLVKDPGKPYQCTMKCAKRFKDKDDWRKHEELNYPQEGWVCDLEGTVVVDGHHVCSMCGTKDPSPEHITKSHGKSLPCHEKSITDRGRLHHRKQHFLQHFRNIHPNIPSGRYLKSSYFTVDSKFPRRCGFCMWKPTTWKERIEHIGAHFIDGQDMTVWRDVDVEDEEDGRDEGEKDGDHDHDGGFNDKDEFFSDDGSDSSDDDSNDAPRPSVSQQQDYRRNNPRFSQQAYNLTMPARVGSPFLGGIRDLFRADSIVSLECTTALRRVSITPHDETPYTRVKLLGVGPYSVVDEVQDTRTGLILARKTVHSSNKVDSCSLKNEVDIMRRLRHPHIVQFLGTYEIGSSISILMNPAADYDLAYFMETHIGKSSPRISTVVQWFSCLVSSVRYIHEQSVKHQDIKPSNILLKNGIIMLADFGIAKTFSDSESTSSTAGAMTRKYCAPETSRLQLRGRSADIFSLGCVLLEMFSFLIYDGVPTFKDFQTTHFTGDHAYHENISHLQNWIEVLKNHPSVASTSFEHYLSTWNIEETTTPDLSKIINTIQPMLEDEPWDRPTALELSSRFPPQQCCLPHTNIVGENIGGKSRTSASPIAHQMNHGHRPSEIGPPSSIQVSAYNTRPMSPTASLDSSLPSSRRFSHFSFMSPSIISTPRTSVGSISHYDVLVGGNVEGDIIKLLEEDENKLSDDDLEPEDDKVFDFTPRPVLGTPNTIYDNDSDDEDESFETWDIPEPKPVSREVVEREEAPPIVEATPEIDEELPELGSDDTADLTGRTDLPLILSRSLFHEPCSRRWNTYSFALKALVFVMIMLLGGLVAQVLSTAFCFAYLFCMTAFSFGIIAAPMQCLNAQDTMTHQVFESLTSVGRHIEYLFQTLAGPVNDLWSLTQKPTAQGIGHYHGNWPVLENASFSPPDSKNETWLSTNRMDRSSYWKVENPLSRISEHELKIIVNAFEARHKLADISPHLFRRGALVAMPPGEENTTLTLAECQKICKPKQKFYWDIGSRLSAWLFPILLLVSTLTLVKCQKICKPNQRFFWDIGQRLSTWLFPILILVSNVELLPLEKRRFMAAIHLLGDPIFSIWSLVHNIHEQLVLNPEFRSELRRFWVAGCVVNVMFYCLSLGTGLFMAREYIWFQVGTASLLITHLTIGLVLARTEVVSPISSKSPHIFARFKPKFSTRKLPILVAALIFFQNFYRKFSFIIPNTIAAPLAHADAITAQSLARVASVSTPVSVIDSFPNDLNLYYSSSDIMSVVMSTFVVLLLVPTIGLFYSGLFRRRPAFSLIWVSFVAAAVIHFQWLFWGYTLNFSHTAESFTNKVAQFGFTYNLNIFHSSSMDKADGLLPPFAAIAAAIFFIWTTKHNGDQGEGKETLFKGPYESMRKLNTGVHLLIDILRTLLRGASNYCMQCMSAPTRIEIDRAYARGKWLNVGVQSMRNLFRFSRKRATLYFLLGISPLAIIFVGMANRKSGSHFITGTALCLIGWLGFNGGSVFVTAGLIIFWYVDMGVRIGGNHPLSSVITSEFATTKCRDATMRSIIFAILGIWQFTAAVVTLIITSGFKRSPENAVNSSLSTDDRQLIVDKMWRVIIGFGAVPCCIIIFYRLLIPESHRHTSDVAYDGKKAATEAQGYFESMSSRNPFEIDRENAMVASTGSFHFQLFGRFMNANLDNFCRDYGIQVEALEIAFDDHEHGIWKFFYSGNYYTPQWRMILVTLVLVFWGIFSGLIWYNDVFLGFSSRYWSYLVGLV